MLCPTSPSTSFDDGQRCRRHSQPDPQVYNALAGIGWATTPFCPVSKADANLKIATCPNRQSKLNTPSLVHPRWPWVKSATGPTLYTPRLYTSPSVYVPSSAILLSLLTIASTASQRLVPARHDSTFPLPRANSVHQVSPTSTRHTFLARALLRRGRASVRAAVNCHGPRRAVWHVARKRAGCEHYKCGVEGRGECTTEE